MVDFSDPFRRGLDAARQAVANRNEVQGIFAQFNGALHEMSGGKAEIALVPLEETLSAFAKLAAALDPSTKKQQVLAVRHLKHKAFQPKVIARWSQSESGYPCTVIWGERHAACDGAESLANELAALFSSPKVGEAIMAAMSFTPAAESPGVEK